MRINRGTHYYNNNISFIDMLFNIIMIFVLLFFIVVLLMNPPELRKKDIDAKADVLIIMTWPDNSPHDIDLWVKPPQDNPIYYLHTENSFMHLDLDDRGAANNWVENQQVKKTLPVRREVISMRGKKDGRYVVNVHFFSAKNETANAVVFEGPPVPVVVELIQVNPQYKILARKEVFLKQVRDVEPVMSFIVEHEVLTDIETDHVESFVYQQSYGN